MRKLSTLSVMVWASLAGLCSILFFACASTPESDSEELREEAPVVREEEPEVFTTVNFAQRLQRILQEGTIEEALAAFQNLPPEYENDLEMQLLYASLLVSAGRLEEASTLTDKLLAAHPGNTDVLTLSMMLAKASGDTATKNAKLKELLKADPNNSDANVALAEDQMLRRNYKLAGQYYRKGLEGDPNHIDALSGYGQALYYTGDDKASRNAFKKILEQDPDNSIAYSFLGKLCNLICNIILNRCRNFSSVNQFVHLFFPTILNYCFLLSVLKTLRIRHAKKRAVFSVIIFTNTRLC